MLTAIGHLCVLVALMSLILDIIRNHVSNSTEGAIGSDLLKFFEKKIHEEYLQVYPVLLESNCDILRTPLEDFISL